MKRIAILGATGMLGHKVIQLLREDYEVWGTVRKEAPAILGGTQMMKMSVYPDQFSSAIKEIMAIKPDVVVNCIGIIKQLAEANEYIPSIGINALWPHVLSKGCLEAGCRMVHISTDCVFSGNNGFYTEDCPTDPVDLYGKTKAMGEVKIAPCVTLRTSIVGRELRSSSGLFEWFISQRGGQVNGFSRAIYTGLTTLEMARVIRMVIEKDVPPGLYHVSSDPIDKYSLLYMVNEAMSLGIQVDRDDELVCDRSLNSRYFRDMTGYVPPSWKQMIEEMTVDPTPY